MHPLYVRNEHFEGTFIPIECICHLYDKKTAYIASGPVLLLGILIISPPSSWFLANSSHTRIKHHDNNCSNCAEVTAAKATR